MIRQLFPIIALFLSAAFLLGGGGIHGVLLPVRAQLEGFSTTSIAMIGTGWAVGFTIGCVLVPRLVRRVGHVRTFGSLCAILATVMLLNGLYVSEVSWILLRAVTGLCFSGSYMIIESWLNERIDNANRGAIFSVYMIVTQAAMMGGQYLLVVADPSRETLFMLGAILYALAVLPTALSSAQSPAPLTQVSFDLRKLYRNSPAAAISAMLAGAISASWGNFAPVFAKQMDMSNTNVANILALAMIGSLLFQMPIGRASDKMDRRYVMIATSLCGALAGFILSTMRFENGQPDIMFFGTILVFGGFIYSLYSLAVAHANDHSAPENFVETSSGLLIIYGAGTMIGPLVTAPLMDNLGPSGLFTFVGAAHMLLAIFISYRVLRRAAPDDEDTVDFQTVPFAKAQTPETYALDPRSEVESDE